MRECDGIIDKAIADFTGPHGSEAIQVHVSRRLMDAGYSIVKTWQPANTAPKGRTEQRTHTSKNKDGDPIEITKDVFIPERILGKNAKGFVTITQWVPPGAEGGNNGRWNMFGEKEALAGWMPLPDSEVMS